jgi:uncharacterized 2Fe-2S/4Fe-4S cluster protein (DUF4445 family)
MEALKIYPFKPAKAVTGGSNFDTERIFSVLPEEVKDKGLKIELPLLQKLPHILREGDEFYALLIREEKNFFLADIFKERPDKVLGLAIDIGSTTIAFYIYDFLKGELLKEYSIYNPQIEFGEDILTRLHFAKKPENLLKLQERTLSAINQEIEKVGFENVYYISLCGNTAMTHFILGLPVNYLIVEPYVAVARWFPLFKGEEVGLKINPRGRIFVFPLAGTYFGGDLIAGLYEAEIYKKGEISFYVDVGTNAEVVLGNKDFLLACAGAAGPALEGGIFECGLKAQPGAVESFWIDEKTLSLSYKTIGDERPLGFCGSAVIQLIADLFLHGWITPEGKFNLKKIGPLIEEINGERVLELISAEKTKQGYPIYIKEGEIKSFLRSKGAMFTILTLLCEKVGLTFKDVEKFYVAGSFGNHIDVRSAVILGMLPEEALFKTIGLGNSAGKGALKFLKRAEYEEIKEITERITYLELNVEGRFMELLTGALIIPHVNLELFPWVKKLLEEK